MVSDAPQDWTDEVTDRFVAAVANVRDRTVEPVQRLTRALVYGVLAVGFAVPAVLFLAIVLFRLLVLVANLLPGPDDNAWMAWMLLGAVTTVGGLLVFTRRNARTDS